MEGTPSLRKAVVFTSVTFDQLKEQSPVLLSLLSEEEIKEVRERMVAPTRANAGEGLKRAVESLILQRTRFDETLEKIKGIIDPNKVRSRSSKADILNAAVERAAAKIRDKGLSQEKLRAFADMFMGDRQLDYTVDELPYQIAVAQIGEE